VTPGCFGVPVPGKGVCDLSYGRERVYSKRDDSRWFHRPQIRGIRSLGASCLLARAGKNLAWHRSREGVWSATRRIRGRKYPAQSRGHRRCSTGNERGTVIATLPAGHFLPKPEYVLPKPCICFSDYRSPCEGPPLRLFRAFRARTHALRPARDEREELGAREERAQAPGDSPSQMRFEKRPCPIPTVLISLRGLNLHGSLCQGPGAISRAEHDAFSPGYEGTRNVFLSPDPPKSTQLVPHGLSARKSLAMPRPGIEAPAVCMAGITCVLTGTFPEAGGGAGLDFGKEKVRGLVQSFGGKVTGALSGRTKILIVGKDPGFSKVDKARQQPAQTSLLSLRDVIQRIVDGTIASTGPGNVQHMEIQSFSSGYGNNSLALLADAETYAIAAGTAAPQATIRNAANTAQVASVAQDSEDAVAAAELPGSSTGLATTTTTTTRSTITTTTTTTTTTSGKARGRPRGRKRARE
jgi:hypothetical protein